MINRKIMMNSVFIPSPPQKCPITGVDVSHWFHVESPLNEDPDSSKPEFVTDGKNIESVFTEKDENSKFEEDFRITIISPSLLHEKLRLTAHCFVKDGVWDNTEVCKVEDEIKGIVYYNTDEPSDEELLQQILEKKRAEQKG